MTMTRAEATRRWYSKDPEHARELRREATRRFRARQRRRRELAASVSTSTLIPETPQEVTP